MVEGKFVNVVAELCPALCNEKVKVSFGGQMDSQDEALWFDFIQILAVADKKPSPPCS